MNISHRHTVEVFLKPAMEFEDQEEEQVGEVELGLTTHDGKMPTPVNSSPPLSSMKWRYKECLKNHAVEIGGHALDGCGEFIAAGEDGTLESLKCAACNCHRNFHRKEHEHDGFALHRHRQILLASHNGPQGHLGYRGPGGYFHLTPPPHQRRVPLLALPSSSGGGPRDDMEEYYSNPSSSGGKKRMRTKFSQDQKDKMLSFSDRLGWRIQKQDEDLVQQFCHEVGIKRNVLKVWMHNNKHTLGKKI